MYLSNNSFLLFQASALQIALQNKNYKIVKLLKNHQKANKTDDEVLFKIVYSIEHNFFL